MEQIEITEFQKILERNPFCKLLGLEVTSVSEGHVQGRIPFDSRFQNMYGDYHGGALYAAVNLGQSIVNRQHHVDYLSECTSDLSFRSFNFSRWKAKKLLEN